MIQLSSLIECKIIETSSGVDNAYHALGLDTNTNTNTKSFDQQ